MKNGRINDLLLESDQFKEGMTGLFLQKNGNEVFLKLAEECNELAAKILKLYTKGQLFSLPPDDFRKIGLLKEIVDVQMNLLLVEQYYPTDVLTEATQDKITKFVESDDYEKYVK